MSARLKRNFPLLKLLKAAKPKQRKAILESSSLDLVDCLSEIAENILKGNIKLTERDKKRLKRYRLFLRQLACNRNSKQQRRRAVLQTGGALPALLAPIIGLAGSLLGSLIH